MLCGMSDFEPPVNEPDEEVVEVTEPEVQEAEGEVTVEPDEEPAEEAPKPRRGKKAKREPRVGVYVLEEGDSPAKVAKAVYGKGSMASALVRHNPDVKWRPGVEINLL